MSKTADIGGSFILRWSEDACAPGICDWLSLLATPDSPCVDRELVWRLTGSECESTDSRFIMVVTNF